jgi:hypothetical protein
MINTADAPSQRSAEPTAPFAPKARENRPRFSRAFGARGAAAFGWRIAVIDRCFSPAPRFDPALAFGEQA